MTQPSIRKNYFYNLCYQILTLITPFITAPYVARVLGADGVGIYSYTSSIMAYFVMFATLGTTNYGTREIARLRDDKYAMSKSFWEIETITVISTLICAVFWLILTYAYTEYTPYFIALIPTLVAVAFDISWFFTGIEQMGYTVLRNSVCRIIGIVCLFVFVKDKSDLTLYILINSLLSLLGNLSMWTYLPSLVQKIPLRTLSLYHHFKETCTYFVITIAISLYTVLDKVLIGLITSNNYENGYYEQANKIIAMAKTVSFYAINTIMTARMSFLFQKQQFVEIKERIQESIDFIFIISYGFVFGIIAVSSNFVPVFFGDGYEPVVGLLCLMSPLLIPIGISTCLGSHYYVPSGNIKKATKLTIIGSIVNLAVNLLLIPKLKASGAVIGSLIGEGFIAVLYVVYSGRYMTFRIIISKSIKKIVAGLAMIAVAYIIASVTVYNTFITLCLQILFCSIMYVVALLIMRDHILIKYINKVFLKFKL
jgi:O-antigen/teichoic acid export membrane protein